MSAFNHDVLRLSKRRTFGLADPPQQFRLAMTLLGITCLFLVLAVGNSYSAFAPLLSSALVAAPDCVGEPS